MVKIMVSTFVDVFVREKKLFQAKPQNVSVVTDFVNLNRTVANDFFLSINMSTHCSFDI